MCELVERLTTVLEEDHKVIACNTTAMGALSETLRSMQTTLELLVGQVTMDINQRNDCVPIRVFLIVVAVLASIVVGLLSPKIADFLVELVR